MEYSPFWKAVTRLAKKFFSFHRHRKFINVSTKAHPGILDTRHNIILPALSNCTLRSGFPIKTLYAFVIVNLRVSYENLRCGLVFSFPIVSKLLGSNILFSTPFSGALNPCSFPWQTNFHTHTKQKINLHFCEIDNALKELFFSFIELLSMHFTFSLFSVSVIAQDSFRKRKQKFITCGFRINFTKSVHQSGQLGSCHFPHVFEFIFKKWGYNIQLRTTLRQYQLFNYFPR